MLWILTESSPPEVEQTLQLILFLGDQSQHKAHLATWPYDGALLFVACDILDRLPHVFGVVGVGVSLWSL